MNNVSGQVENSENSEISEILAIGQNRKLGNKKTRNNISEISEVSEFSICHFSFFKNFFSHFSTVSNSVLSIYVMFCFQSLLKCCFFQQKYMLKILPSLAVIRYFVVRCTFTHEVMGYVNLKFNERF